MKLKLISCEVLYREMCAAVARSPHQVDLEFVAKDKNSPECGRLRTQLQRIINRQDPATYDAIVLGYALCGDGVVGLKAGKVRLVIPRSQDCIALLMGNQQRYEEYVQLNAGVFFRSTGWLERGESGENSDKERPNGGYTLDELVCRYGEESGAAMFNEMNNFPNSYKQLTFIETGVEPNSSFEQRAREEAARKGWRFSKMFGDTSVLSRLVSGDWSVEEFLIVPPGHKITKRNDAGLLTCEPA